MTSPPCLSHQFFTLRSPQSLCPYCAGYEEESLSFVREVMLNRDIPDPRDMRRFDVLGPLGSVNFRQVWGKVWIGVNTLKGVRDVARGVEVLLKCC